ncbi:restriction endonuclease [Rhodococcus sp. HNM0569]|uniref:restriction endonuclease n=1 Tax=Rhodococcus sp. HNM0569 TaxID=2716340 RepID=UPI003211E9BF
MTTRIRTSADAEENAAEYMRALAFPDATALALGTGHGIDVYSSGAYAQCRWRGSPADVAQLESLYSTRGVDSRRDLLYFSAVGYTDAARTYARSTGIALFVWDADGRVAPDDERAKALVARGHTTTTAPPPRPAPAPAPTRDQGVHWRAVGQRIGRVLSPLTALWLPHWRVVAAVLFTLVLLVAPFGDDMVPLRVFATLVSVVGAPVCWFLSYQHWRSAAARRMARSARRYG